MNREPVTEVQVAEDLEILAHHAQKLAHLIRDSASKAMTDEDAVTVYERLKAMESMHALSRRHLVMHLRDIGASWEVVGGLLGMSRQAAHERYASYERR